MSTPQIHRLDNGINAAHYIGCVQLDAPEPDDAALLLRNLGATGIAAFCDESGCVHVDAEDVDDALAVTRVTLSGRPWTRVAPSHAAGATTGSVADDGLEARTAGDPSPQRDADHAPPERDSGALRGSADHDDLAPRGPEDEPHLSRRGHRDHPSGTGPRRWNRRLRGPSDPDAEAGDHYVPPPPPALPESNAITILGWVGVLGAPAFVLIASLLGFNLGAFALLTCLGAFLGGFAVLLLGAQDRPPTDSGWDDGAVL